MNSFACIFKALILTIFLSSNLEAFQILGDLKKKTLNRTGNFSESFVIKNDKQQPLIIISAETSFWRCKVQFEKRPIVSAKLSSLIFECSNLEKGAFSKSAYVVTNQGSITIRVQGEADPSPEDLYCPDVNLESPGGSMEHVVGTNQKNFSTCYANAVGQLYDAWRFAHGDKNYKLQTSGVELAYSYSLAERNGENPGIGLLGEEKLLNFIKKRGGTCSDSFIVSKFPIASDPSFLGSVEDIYNSYSLNRGIDKILFTSSAHLGQSTSTAGSINKIKIAQALETKRVSTELYTCFNNYNVEPKNDLLKSLAPLLSKESLIKFIEKATPLFCPKNELLKMNEKYKTESLIGPSMRDITNRIDNLKSMPLAVGVCSSIFIDGRNNKNCKIDHTVLLTGVRRNKKTQKCEVLIRNSWGSASRYANSIWETSGNSIWIEAQYIVPTIDALNTIKQE